MIFTINNFCLRFSQWIFLHGFAYNYIYKSGCKCMLEKEKVANSLCLWHFKRIVRKFLFHFIRHLRLFILHFEFLKIFLFSFQHLPFFILIFRKKIKAPIPAFSLIFHLFLFLPRNFLPFCDTAKRPLSTAFLINLSVITQYFYFVRCMIAGKPADKTAVSLE